MKIWRITLLCWYSNPYTISGNYNQWKKISVLRIQLNNSIPITNREKRVSLYRALFLMSKCYHNVIISIFVFCKYVIILRSWAHSSYFNGLNVEWARRRFAWMRWPWGGHAELEIRHRGRRAWHQMKICNLTGFLFQRRIQVHRSQLTAWSVEWEGGGFFKLGRISCNGSNLKKQCQS